MIKHFQYKLMSHVRHGLRIFAAGLLLASIVVGYFAITPALGRANFLIGSFDSALVGPLAIVPSVQVAISPAKQPIQTLQVHLGTPTGDLSFTPEQLTFEAGQRYKLILDNPSPQKHYFTAKDFADAIWSQKVDAGNVEVKGAIHELEIRPNAVAEWVFVPQKAGVYELHCSIAGHAEAGMVGDIRIVD